MIGGLLPSCVAVVEAFADLPGEAVFAGEEDLVANAVEVRRREFVTARRCARTALGHLGFGPAPIRSGARREPQWPAGAIGSITHCTGYRAAAVARSGAMAGIGIDAEPHIALPGDVTHAVTLPEEREMLSSLDRSHPGVHWGKLLFSAKESVYKAWYPLTGRWLGFEEAHLTIDPAAGTFHARLLVPGTRGDGAPPLVALAGRFLAERGLILTAVTVS